MITADRQQQAKQSRAQSTASKSPLLIVFLLTILLPISIEVVGLRLSPNRLYLLIFSVPFAFRVLQGHAGRLTFVDMLFMLLGLWILLSQIALQGTDRIPFAGITVVEMVGGYFVGRVLVRNVQSYNVIIKFLLIAMVCLLPVALAEALTGKTILPDLFRIAFDAPARGGSSANGRLGLDRVYSVFHHPILFGLFCSIAFANVFYLFSGRARKITLAALLTFGMSFLSLSSAPLLACGVQIGLLIWNRITGGRWLLLLAMTVIMYVAVDLASNRTPIIILIETVTFDPGTGWTRIAINKYGWASVWAHPIFGLGFNDWSRPSWLTSSVDNFWLVMAMRYGLVGLGLIVAAFLFHMLALARARISRKDIIRCRTAYGIVLIGTCFTLITVHIWDTMSVFVMFFVGAGAWMYTTDWGEETEGELGTAPNTRADICYTRFQQNKSRTIENATQQSARK